MLGCPSLFLSFLQPDLLSVCLSPFLPAVAINDAVLITLEDGRTNGRTRTDFCVPPFAPVLAAIPSGRVVVVSAFLWHGPQGTDGRTERKYGKFASYSTTYNPCQRQICPIVEGADGLVNISRTRSLTKRTEWTDRQTA